LRLDKKEPLAHVPEKALARLPEVNKTDIGESSLVVLE